MKEWKAAILAVAMTVGFAGITAADPVPTQVSTVTVPVLIPATVAVPVVTSTPTVTEIPAEREGDWYVVRGTAELDRSRSALRVKNDQGVLDIINGNNVHIYRRGQLISYQDVNQGDWVTVRYKSS